MSKTDFKNKTILIIMQVLFVNIESFIHRIKFIKYKGKRIALHRNGICIRILWKRIR